MSLVIFVLIFLLIVNKHLIKSFLEGFIKGRADAKDLTDPKILDFIKEKSGLKLKKVKLLDTQATWGMMAGLPSMPYMIVSKDAYENFSEDELQWLLLHEAGHYVLWHNQKLILLQLSLIFLGLLLLLSYEFLALALGLGLLLPILNTQFARRFEYEANYYALSKMDNPRGLKNMYEKARDRWRSKGKKEDTLLQKLFNVWILDIYKDLVKRSAA